MVSTPEATYLAAAGRGIDWIRARQRADGSFTDPADGIGAYYKVPYALALSGHPAEGLRLARWIRAHHAAPDGDFRHGDAGATPGARHERWPTYQQAWLVQGLHRLGCWDLSHRGAAHLKRFQLPVGGFYAEQEGQRFVEPVCTSWSGLAMLATGDLEAARQAGAALVRMVRAQPRPDRFYFRMDPAGALVTAVPAGEELFHFVDAGRPEQIYYNPGIALIFLAHLHRATGEGAALEACEALLAFTQRCAADVYRFPPSGKLGVGCALLWEVTGSGAARRGARAVADYLVETQTAEGKWVLPDAGPYRGAKYRGNPAIDLDIAAEFSTFLLEIAARV